jgi:hypothetical protein
MGFSANSEKELQSNAPSSEGLRSSQSLCVRKTYFSPEALRNANGAMVNKLLALRDPRLWGEGASSCASDATKFESWKQNPMTVPQQTYHSFSGSLGTSSPGYPEHSEARANTQYRPDGTRRCAICRRLQHRRAMENREKGT